MAEIHGLIVILEESRDNVKGLLDALSSAMETDSDDPRPLEVHDRHETLITQFPALSIDLMGYETEQRDGGLHTYPTRVSCQVRVHTSVDYPGAFVDTVTVKRLLNSVDNYLKTDGHTYLKTNMSDGFARIDYEPQSGEGGLAEFNVAFGESDTVGGYLNFDLQFELNYIQA